MTSLVDRRYRRLSRHLRLLPAPAYYACVTRAQVRIFPWGRPPSRPLPPASSAVISSTETRVHPIRGRPIIRLAENVSLVRTVADVRNHESGFALFSRWKGRVREI